MSQNATGESISKNVTVSVKVTQREATMLRALAKGGSPGKGLRYLIDKHLWRKNL